MTAAAALAALALPPNLETFGLPPCDTHLIAKLRNMPADLLATITGKEEDK